MVEMSLEDNVHYPLVNILAKGLLQPSSTEHVTLTAVTVCQIYTKAEVRSEKG